MKINFKAFKTKPVFGLQASTIDVREQLAQHLYTRVSGERAYDMAYTIGQSQEAIDLNDQQIEFLKSTAKETMTGFFYDSLLFNIKNVQSVGDFTGNTPKAE